jgi:site-specific DNA-cytosine methylase
MQKIRHLDLFTGYGGFSLALRRVLGEENVETTGFSEIERNANALLRHRFGGVENLGDITKIDADKLPDCDLITSGSPCLLYDEKVITSNGIKKCQDIDYSDKLLTDNGVWKKPSKNRYRMLGNGVVVKVVEVIFQRMFLEEENA